MNENVNWTDQRIDLLRKHILEWENNNDLELKSFKVLSDNHQEERANLSPSIFPTAWLQLIANYKTELINLAEKNYNQQNMIRARHDQQIIDLESQIKKSRHIDT